MLKHPSLKVLFCLVFFVLWALPVLAQDVDTSWVKIYNGLGNGGDFARAVAVDNSGNVYVTGWSTGSGTGPDYVTIKYAPDGTEQWVRRYNGPGNGVDDAYAIAVDGSGNVYVTGQVWNGSNYDYMTIKYDTNGTQLWALAYPGMGSHDMARDIAVDASGNVYVTGYSVTPPSGGDIDYATIKYDTNGGFVWLQRYDGPASGDDSASAIAVDGSGNVYVTGQIKIQSSPPYELRGYGTVKYGPAGNLIWARWINPPPYQFDYAYDVAVDGSGNVYITGKGHGVSLDYLTAKYNINGNLLWTRTYNGPGNSDDFASAITIDGSGNVYVTGQSTGSGTGLDYATVKYDPAGTQLWDRRYNGTGNTDDFASAITLDGSGNVYVGGGSIGSGTGYDYATVKYDLDGTQLWDRRYNGTGNTDDAAYDIAVDNSGNVYVTGHSGGSGTGQDYGTIKYWQNYPPSTFSLLSPEDGLLIPPGVVGFDWEDASDSDPWDTVRFDLYVSTSPVFHPDSTTIYDSLLTSEYSDNFGTGTYYWKVRAYDNHAETWSNQTWNFVVVLPLFGPASNYEVGSYPNSVFCADLDGDGDLDLAVANHESQSVSVLKNIGNGTFADTVNYSVGNHPISIFCADLDGDGDLDLAVSCEFAGVFIFKNNGNGTFVDAGSYPAGTSIRFLFCADLDEDDDLDLAVADAWGDRISILKNNGNGTFTNAFYYGVGDEPVSPFCADLDGDGDLDLAVANAYSDNVSILKNNGDGTFQTKLDYPVIDGPHSVFSMDLDMDGDLDLAVTNGFEDSGDSISVLMNNGDGTFANATNYKVGPRALYLFSSDIDGDADFDLAVANSWSNNVSILRNNGAGTFAAAVNYETPSGPMYPFCADLDADGDFDLAVTIGYSGNVVSILKNLTQVPANQPPHPFPLLSPEDGSWAPQVLTLDWRIPYDPNFGDQIRYDLYISTVPSFDPDSTIIHSGLVTSRDSVTLGTDTYYWKVKAYDNWGAEVWSTQTWSFTTTSSSALVGYWKFDEGTGTMAYDSSGYANDGTLMNGPVWVDGMPLLGKALDFDGTNDYVIIYDSPSLDVNGPGITFMAWIYSPAFHDCGWIVGKGEGDLIWGLLLESDGDIRYWIRSGGTRHEQWGIPVGLTTDIWQHVAVVYDGSYMRFYLNAEEKDNYPKTGNMNTNDEPVYIGLDGWNQANHYIGKIDQVKIYGRALSPEEIEAEFESGFTRGDVTGEGVIDIGDVVYILNYLFKNGTPPSPMASGDTNCDGIVDIGDIIYLLNYLFKNGDPPSC